METTTKKRRKNVTQKDIAKFIKRLEDLKLLIAEVQKGLGWICDTPKERCEQAYWPVTDLIELAEQIKADLWEAQNR